MRVICPVCRTKNGDEGPEYVVLCSMCYYRVHVIAQQNPDVCYEVTKLMEEFEHERSA